MAIVNFKKGLLANLPSTYSEGTFYVTTDERAIYLDVDGSNRIRLGDYQAFATIDALKANTNPSETALYYVEDINCLAKWDGTDYIQINRDTGMTSVEVTGSGNAVTAAVYSADGRKLTLTKGATFATREYVGEIPEGYTEQTIVAYINKKAEETLEAANGGSSESAASVKEALDNYIEETDPRLEALEAIDHDHSNKTELDLIQTGDVAKWNAAQANAESTAAGALASAKSELEGKISDAEQAAKDYADGRASNYDSKGSAAAVQTKLDEEVARATEAEGINAAAAKAADDKAVAAQNAANAKVASVTAGDASVKVGGSSTAPTVAVQLSQDADNAMSLEDDGLKVVIPAAAEYSVVKDANSGEYAAVYHLTKGGVNVGAAINIPKDLMVKSGSVDAQGNIVLVLNDAESTEIVIPASSLIEYVTSGSATGDMVVITVSDDHKVTASITDGTITAAKLTTELQTKINKAHDHANKDVIDGITATKVEAWDAAEQNAKDYADDLNTAMDTRVTKIEGDYLKAADKNELSGLISAEAETARAAEKANADAIDAIEKDYLKAADKTELSGLITAEKERAEAAEAQALADAKAYADGLAGNYDSKGSAAAAESAAKAYADGLAGNYDANGSAAGAEQAAKSYADTQITTALTWGSF